MSENDSANNAKKPRATYSPLILLAVGIGAYAYYNIKPQGPETIPDLQLSQIAQAQAPAGADETTDSQPETGDHDEAAGQAEMAATAEEQTADATATNSDPEPAPAISLESMIKPRTLGSDDAPVKIVEHASFTCPHCADFHKGSFKNLVNDYVNTGKAQIKFVDFPLNRPAADASVISRCIPEKNYFNFVRLLFETQQDWTSSSDYKKALKQHAMIAGLSSEAFEGCIANEELQKGLLDQARQASEALKINSVPTLVVNGTEVISGNVPYEDMKKVIDAQLALSGGE